MADVLMLESRDRSFGRRWLAIALLLILPATAQCQTQDWQTLGLMRVRDMTPWGLSRLDMLPAHAVASKPGTFAFEFNFSYQNTWAVSDNVLDFLSARDSMRADLSQDEINSILALPGDSYLVDGEYGLLDLTMHYRLSSHWGTYLTIPYYSFSNGFLDSTIESFHETFGFDAAGRDNSPRNRWQLIANLSGVETVYSHAPSDALGDPVLGFRYVLKPQPKKWNLIAEFAAKVPRGDEEFLVSTGKPDYGLQVSLQRFFQRNALYATVSTVYFSSADTSLYSDQWIPTLVLGWETRLTPNINLILQTYATGSTVQESSLDEELKDRLQVLVGIQSLYRGNVFRFGLTENLTNSSNAPDIGLTLSFAHVFP